MSRDSGHSEDQANKRSGVLLVAVLAFAVAGLAMVVLSTTRLAIHRQADAERARAAAQSAAVAAARRLEARLGELLVARDIAAEVSDGVLTDAEMRQRLAAAVRNSPAISLTVAYLPSYVPDSFTTVDDAAIYFLNINTAADHDAIEFNERHYTNQDIEDPGRRDATAWYREALQQNKPSWHGPYYSPATTRWWAGGYSIPFARGNGATPQGVISAEFTLQHIQEAVNQVIRDSFKEFPLEASYSFIVSRNGRINSHPDRTVVEQRKTIADFHPDLRTAQDIAKLPLAEDTGDTDVHVLKACNAGVVQPCDHDAHSGHNAWTFFAPVDIDDSGLWVAIVIDDDAVAAGAGVLALIQADKIKLAMSILLFLFAVSLLLFRAHRPTPARLWAVAASFTLLCFAGIGYLWFLNLTTIVPADEEDIVLFDNSIPAKVRLQYDMDNAVESIAIPTGVFIQSIEFSSPTDVTVTGYLWQKYPDDLPEWIRPKPDVPGFILPESEDTEVSEVYQRYEAGHEVLGWYFKAVLRQEFDYTHYPFDRESVWIRLWHHQFGRGVMLKPDLAAYDTMVSTDQAKPGLEQEGFVLEGWDVTSTYFSYRPNSYNTDFGLADYSGQRNFPELYFNISMQRRFINTFIINFIPLTVVAFLLFAVLHTVRVSAEDKPSLGFSTSGVLGFCAALFFIVIIAHINLRESLAAQRLVYIEYFFFVIYLAFVGVAINAMLVAEPFRIRWIRYGDNLIARLAYWPLLGGLMLAVTLFTFWPAAIASS